MSIPLLILALLLGIIVALAYIVGFLNGANKNR